MRALRQPICTAKLRKGPVSALGLPPPQQLQSTSLRLVSTKFLSSPGQVLGSKDTYMVGTLVASASGFVLSQIIYAFEPNEDHILDVESCHYTDSSNGVCVVSNSLFTETTTGAAITGTLQQAVPTNTSKNGASAGSKLTGRMLALLVAIVALFGAGL